MLTRREFRVVSAVQNVPNRILTPEGLTVGLVVFGLGYPLGLLWAGSLPWDAGLEPYLLAGAVAGVAIDRALGDGGLTAVIRGERRLFASTRGRSARWLEETVGLSTGGDRDDSVDDESVGWSNLWLPISIVSSVGTLWFLDPTSPWIVGLVLGVVWSLASVRLLWWLSPVTDGTRRPPRGVDVTEESHR